MSDLRPLRPFGVLFAALVLLSGCETTNVAPAHQEGMSLDRDEARLWARVAEERDALDRSGFVAVWPEVESYLDRVLAGLHPGPLPGEGRFKVKVLIDPTLNAFSLPDGVIYLHTGMLARLDNEAQLAAVLSHELTHATRRHGLKSYRNIKNESAFYATLTIGTGGIGGLLGLIGVNASISGYSQDLEREADAEGFQLLLSAGYDPRESPKVFRKLLEESKRSKIKQPFFFGSHPRLEERSASYEALIEKVPADRRAGRLGTTELEAVLPPVLVANAEAALRAGDFDSARTCAERALQLRPDDPFASYHLAEVFRKRGEKGDLDAALKRYRALAAAHPDFPEAQRGLGLVLLKTSDQAGAAAAFARYLVLRPGADDRAYIESFIQQCQNKI